MSHAIQINDAITQLDTIRDFIRWAVTQFNQKNLVYGHGTDNAWDEAVNLILTCLRLAPDIDTHVLDAKLCLNEKKFIAKKIQERIEKRIPVPYLVNEAWFAGLNFYVDQRVIIPRSPIAELIEEQFSPWVEEGNLGHMLDLCTGSGCIAISCALTFPEAKIDAVDLSESALEVAKRNVARYGLEDSLQLYTSDLFNALEGKRYDLIVSNPPYVADQEYSGLPSEYKHEPREALLSGEDGLEIIKRILAEAEQYLTPTGVLIVEVGAAQEVLEAAYPDVPFTWLQFERGGEGVFLLTAQELKEFRHWLKN